MRGLVTRPADVVFLFPPASGNAGSFNNHLGVAYLRAALRNEPLSTMQYLNPRPGTVRQVARDVAKHKPGVVGFTVYDGNFALCLALAAEIKRIRKGIRVVFGGPSATFCWQAIIERHSCVDACVLGEAEETGARIFQALLNSGRIGAVLPGLVFRSDGEVHGGELPPLAGAGCTTPHADNSLDVIASPYLTGILQEGQTGILTGRGCTHHCQYCCFAALGRQSLRLHSIGRVLDELECIAAMQKAGGRRYVVSVHDDAFTLLPARAKALCQAMVDRRLDLMLSCITRADAVDEELLRLMRDAGFVSLAFGLESAVPSVLRATGKVRPPGWLNPDLGPERDFVERVRQSVVTARKLGLTVGVSIILGLPSERLEDGERTLSFVDGLPVDSYIHNFLWVFPGTPLWQTHERYGIKCSVHTTGLPVTTEYAYDVTKLRPRRRCSLEQDARLMKMLATDALYGCEASLKREGGISVVVIHGGKLRPAVAQWLAGVIDVGATVLQLYSGLRTSRSPQIDEDRRVLAEALVPARYHLQMLGRPLNGHETRWKLVSAGIDVYSVHKPALVSFVTSGRAGPLLDWMGGVPAAPVLGDAAGCLRQSRRLVKLFAGAQGSDVGARMRRMPAPPGLRHSGRWLPGRAPCRSLTRIEVDGDGHIRPCRHGDVIGRIGDAPSLLKRRLARLAAGAEWRRGCPGCSATDCPRCPFPGVDDATYCRVMRKERTAVRALEWVHVYSRLPSLLSMERDKYAGD